MSSKDKLKKAKEKSQKRRLEKAEEFSDKLVDKLGDKVKCVAVYGSVSKQEHTHESDIDTFVVLDDTKLEHDVPSDAKNKIRRKVTQLAKEVDDRITIQYFTFLTEFWNAIRKGEPLVITVLRLGIPVYDVGIFKPAKRLLQRGKISSSKEAVRKRLKLAAAGYKKSERRIKSSIPHNLEQAMANAGQAPIMLVGRSPPGKEEVPEVLEEMFVENDMLDKKYVEMAKEIHELSSKAEKDKIEITGELLDEYMEKTDEFIRRMHKLVSQLGAKKKVKKIIDDYKTFLKANVAALKSHGVEPPERKEELPEVVEEELNFGESHQKLFEKWDGVIQKVKDKNLGEVNEKELYEVKRETKDFVSEIGKELKKLKEEGKEEFEPDIDTEKVAKHMGKEEGKLKPDKESGVEESSEDD